MSPFYGWILDDYCFLNISYLINFYRSQGYDVYYDHFSNVSVYRNNNGELELFGTPDFRELTNDDIINCLDINPLP